MLFKIIDALYNLLFKINASANWRIFPTRTIQPAEFEIRAQLRQVKNSLTITLSAKNTFTNNQIMLLITKQATEKQHISVSCKN